MGYDVTTELEESTVKAVLLTLNLGNELTVIKNKRDGVLYLCDIYKKCFYPPGQGGIPLDLFV